MCPALHLILSLVPRGPRLRIDAVGDRPRTHPLANSQRSFFHSAYEVTLPTSPGQRPELLLSQIISALKTGISVHGGGHGSTPLFTDDPHMFADLERAYAGLNVFCDSEKLTRLDPHEVSVMQMTPLQDSTPEQFADIGRVVDEAAGDETFISVARTSSRDGLVVYLMIDPTKFDAYRILTSPKDQAKATADSMKAIVSVHKLMCTECLHWGCAGLQNWLDQNGARRTGFEVDDVSARECPGGLEVGFLRWMQGVGQPVMSVALQVSRQCEKVFNL